VKNYRFCRLFLHSHRTSTSTNSVRQKSCTNTYWNLEHLMIVTQKVTCTVQLGKCLNLKKRQEMYGRKVNLLCPEFSNEVYNLPSTFRRQSGCHNFEEANNMAYHVQYSSMYSHILSIIFLYCGGKTSTFNTSL
jgi:hypothetical protein